MSDHLPTQPPSPPVDLDAARRREQAARRATRTRTALVGGALVATLGATAALALTQAAADASTTTSSATTSSSTSGATTSTGSTSSLVSSGSGSTHATTSGS